MPSERATHDVVNQQRARCTKSRSNSRARVSVNSIEWLGNTSSNGSPDSIIKLAPREVGLQNGRSIPLTEKDCLPHNAYVPSPVRHCLHEWPSAYLTYPLGAARSLRGADSPPALASDALSLLLPNRDCQDQTLDFNIALGLTGGCSWLLSGAAGSSAPDGTPAPWDDLRHRSRQTYPSALSTRSADVPRP